MYGRNVIAVLLLPTLLRLGAAGKHQAMCETRCCLHGPPGLNRVHGGEAFTIK